MEEKIEAEDPIRILIVDDDPVDIEIFSEALATVHVPYTLAGAKDVAQMFAMLSTPPLPHVIFLDINLPKTSGIVGLQSLKAYEAYRDFPVIMFSVSDHEKDIEAAFTGGA